MSLRRNHKYMGTHKKLNIVSFILKSFFKYLKDNLLVILHAEFKNRNILCKQPLPLFHFCVHTHLKTVKNYAQALYKISKKEKGPNSILRMIRVIILLAF